MPAITHLDTRPTYTYEGRYAAWAPNKALWVQVEPEDVPDKHEGIPFDPISHEHASDCSSFVPGTETHRCQHRNNNGHVVKDARTYVVCETCGFALGCEVIPIEGDEWFTEEGDEDG